MAFEVSQMFYQYLNCNHVICQNTPMLFPMFSDSVFDITFTSIAISYRYSSQMKCDKSIPDTHLNDFLIVKFEN